MRSEPAKCCGKRRYRTRPKAEKALEKWQAVRGDSGPKRTYRCPNGFWHLTHLSKGQFEKINKADSKEGQQRRELMSKVIRRDGRCVVCGSKSGILSVHPRVVLTPVNDRFPSSYITAHAECLHHGRLSSDDKFYRGYKLDPHMTKDAPRYPIWNYDRWYYANTDGTIEEIKERQKR